MDIKIHKYSVSRKITLIWIILVVGLVFLVNSNLYSQETGYKYFKNYSYRDYEHLPQNWGMAQHQDGIIYVANQAGVLIYDGVSWRVIGIPHYATVRSLAIDEDGTVYIGGVGEIGYLEAAEKGTLKYKSLMDQLKEEQQKFSEIWRTVANEKKIYFSSSNFLFRWDPKDKQMKVWKSAHRFLYPFRVKGKFFIHQEKVGLMNMVNDSLKLLAGGGIFSDDAGTIFMIVPYDADNNSQTLLIGTRLKGFFLYDFDKKTVTPFPTEVDDYLKENTAYHGTRLSTGDFALATRQGGLVIMDSHGRLKYIFDNSSGLQNDCVYYVFEDNQGNLWLCLDNGISKIEYNSPFSIYDNRYGLPPIVLSVIRHHSHLYVGTTQGLYMFRPGANTFSPIAGMSNFCRNLLSVENSILAATSSGVFLVDSKNNVTQNIIKSESFALLPSNRYPGRIWCGTRSGLLSLVQKNRQWLKEHLFQSVDQSIEWIAEEENGNLWLVTSKGRVLKVEFPVDINHPVVTLYNTDYKVLGGRVVAAVAAGHVMFATDKGLFRFDEKNKKFIPDKTLGNEYAGGSNSKPVFRLIEDKDKNIWFHSKSMNYKAIPGSEDSPTIESDPFRCIPMVQVNTIYQDPDGKNIWFGSNDGLICYDKTFKKIYNLDIPTFIQGIEINRKPYEGVYKIGSLNAPYGFNPIFSYNERNIRFKYTAPFFESESSTQYSYLLEGYDKDWSDWTLEHQKDYTNLDAGSYNFKFQARNVYGILSSTGNFRFKILAPWYKKWWAFILYFILVVFLMFLVVKWRSFRLLHEKKRLELVVQQRTKEIKEKNTKLEKQTLQLKDQSEKLKEMDQLKSRFFANISHEFRTPLTLIMSPLEKMLSYSRDKEQKKEFRLMRRNSQRLLTLINQLLDLSRFDSGKMELQASCQNIIPFLKGTVASFHMVAVENQLELEFYSEQEEISLFFDAQKMEEVMYNLLINAIKFTPPGGKISVSVNVGKDRQDQAKEELDFVYISLQDTGPGIPPGQLSHIFNRFYQAEGIAGRGHKGTGIGLALAKEIVLQHHGKIDVHSQEGKGTEFVIQLPMGPDHLKPGEIVSTSQDVSGKGKCKEIEILHVAKGLEEEEEEDNRDTGEVESMGKVETDIHGNEIHRLEKNIILVVEDEPDVREFIRAPLEPFYTLVEAEDGQEGIAKAKEIIPDLIVSDIMMPGTDGYELCRVLKRDISTSHIPVILLTAKASEESIIQGLETGADDYITKPFNTKMLLNRIKNLIELRRQLQLKIQRKKMLLPTEISVSSPDEKFLTEFQGIIEKNLSDPDFNVDELSKKLYMGRSTMFRKIHALTGETPNQFILSYRLGRGAQLLREKFGNVTEIALEVGFSSSPYFSKLFKEKFHQTPSEFQASQTPSGTVSKPSKDH